MKILLLGGTGAMGAHLVDILSKDKDNFIFVTTRKTYFSNTDNVQFLHKNAMDEDDLCDILKLNDWDCIVDFMVYETEQFNKRIQELLKSCKQYVFLSSSRVYADSNIPITENSKRLLDVTTDKDYLKTDEYALTKARQENLLFENKNKNWTIIRPYITYSENRLQLGVHEKELWLNCALKYNKLIFSNDIAKHITTITYGYDVARGIAAIIGNQSALGEAFHITGNNSISWQKVYEIYSQTLKENGFYCDEYIREKTYKLQTKGKYQVLYDRYYDRIFDNSKIEKYLDVSTFVTPEEGLKKCLCAFLRNPIFLTYDVQQTLLFLGNTKTKLPFNTIKGIKQKIKYILIKLHLY